MTDERLKIWIELGKWAVVSVGLVIMTKIIDTGFKDREVGLSELKEYDKYVSLVTDNTKISERRLLAQFFAHVTPSDKLKEGWADYFKTVDEEYQQLQKEKREKEEELAKLISKPESAREPSAKLQILQNEIQQIDKELTPTFQRAVSSNDLNAALEWEKIGFENILNRDLDQAIAAFESAEKSYNGFHQVYEIARFLRSRAESSRERDQRFWNSIYQTLLKDYSWKMPEKARVELERRVQ